MSFDEGQTRQRAPRQEQKLVVEAGSLNEALAAAAAQWGVSAEDLRADVVGSERGFLGLFGNKLKVEVHPVKPIALVKGVDFTNRVLALMGMDARAGLRQEDETIEIEGPDAQGYIVRRYGDCLKAIEYLLNLALRDPSVEPRVKLDSCGYRERRTRSLERLAEATARQVVEYGRPIRMEPMLSWERWVMHTALKDRNDVRTESVGEPPMRKVVVMPQFDPNSSRGYRSRPPRPSRDRDRDRYPRRRY